MIIWQQRFSTAGNYSQAAALPDEERGVASRQPPFLRLIRYLYFYRCGMCEKNVLFYMKL